MSFYKFEEDDLFLNTIQTYPQNNFFIQSGTVYINNFPHLTGTLGNNLIGVPKGFISLYEYNINRAAGNLIHPFVIKDGMRNSFKKTNVSDYNSLGIASTITSSYNMSASLTRFYIDPPLPVGTIYRFSSTGATINGPLIGSLENIFNEYSYLSPHYQYSSSLGDKSSQNASLINIASIFYGSNIKKGTVSLKYYITGTLIGELQDYRLNGDLVQVGPSGSTGSGSVAGSVLYNEWFIYLTGSWNLDNASISYDGASGTSKWIHFGVGINNISDLTTTNLSASFAIDFSGSNQIQTMTMLAHAKYGDLNHSNNPTFADSTDINPISKGPYTYTEQPKKIKNIVSSSFVDVIPTFEKTTYLSTIALYDKDKNLIGMAKMATPVRKTEADQYTFKLKLDI